MSTVARLQLDLWGPFTRSHFCRKTLAPDINTWKRSLSSLFASQDSWLRLWLQNREQRDRTPHFLMPDGSFFRQKSDRVNRPWVLVEARAFAHAQIDYTCTRKGRFQTNTCRNWGWNAIPIGCINYYESFSSLYMLICCNNVDSSLENTRSQGHDATTFQNSWSQ
jgi:hypothetical protein